MGLCAHRSMTGRCSGCVLLLYLPQGVCTGHWCCQTCPFNCCCRPGYCLLLHLLALLLLLLLLMLNLLHLLLDSLLVCHQQTPWLLLLLLHCAVLQASTSSASWPHQHPYGCLHHPIPAGVASRPARCHPLCTPAQNQSTGSTAPAVHAMHLHQPHRQQTAATVWGGGARRQLAAADFRDKMTASAWLCHLFCSRWNVRWV